MLSSILGKSRLNMAKAWFKTGAIYGAATSAGVLYFTDWKLILQYLPIYNTKFKTEEVEE